MRKEIITIPFLGSTQNNIEDYSILLDKQPKNSIGFNPWKEKFNGKAEFAIAYTENAIILKYYVIEEHIRAIFTKSKDPVYKDSCVEFFISFDNEKDYYNLEFNCTGTCLAGFGKHRTDRELLDNIIIDEIQSMSKFNHVTFNGKNMISWELTLILNKDIFVYHQIDELKGISIDVNFYKCGDDLPNPHYLSWSEIKSDEPNFHLPAFFGQATFA